MELIFFPIGKKIVFSKVFKYLSNSFNINLLKIFYINQDIIQI